MVKVCNGINFFFFFAVIKWSVKLDHLPRKSSWVVIPWQSLKNKNFWYVGCLCWLRGTAVVSANLPHRSVQASLLHRSYRSAKLRYTPNLWWWWNYPHRAHRPEVFRRGWSHRTGCPFPHLQMKLHTPLVLPTKPNRKQSTPRQQCPWTIIQGLRR